MRIPRGNSMVVVSLTLASAICAPAWALSVGSWRSTPTDRKAIAFDAQSNRLYWNSNGQVVGRYHAGKGEFQQGAFEPVYWYSLDVGDGQASSAPDLDDPFTDDTEVPLPDTPDPEVTASASDDETPEREEFKPEIWRGGRKGTSSRRVRVIETVFPESVLEDANR